VNTRGLPPDYMDSTAQHLLNLLSVDDWRRLARYTGKGSDWAYSVSAVINLIAQHQETIVYKSNNKEATK
jgi:hypothetical protein